MFLLIVNIFIVCTVPAKDKKHMSSESTPEFSLGALRRPRGMRDSMSRVFMGMFANQFADDLVERLMDRLVVKLDDEKLQFFERQRKKAKQTTPSGERKVKKKDERKKERNTKPKQDKRSLGQRLRADPTGVPLDKIRKGSQGNKDLRYIAYVERKKEIGEKKQAQRTNQFKWFCICGWKNLIRSTKCGGSTGKSNEDFGCGRPRPSGWKCSECKYVNMFFMKVCGGTTGVRGCKEPRPEWKARPLASKDWPQWICSNCSVRNWLSFKHCGGRDQHTGKQLRTLGCGKPRTADDVIDDTNYKKALEEQGLYDHLKDFNFSPPAKKFSVRRNATERIEKGERKRKRNAEILQQREASRTEKIAQMEKDEDPHNIEVKKWGFIAASTFGEKVEDKVFKLGPLGLGYYKDLGKRPKVERRKKRRRERVDGFLVDKSDSEMEDKDPGKNQGMDAEDLEVENEEERGAAEADNMDEEEETQEEAEEAEEAEMDEEDEGVEEEEAEEEQEEQEEEVEEAEEYAYAEEAEEEEYEYEYAEEADEEEQPKKK
eukprot:gnl/MRDRNA2_/MRDRNA2_121280_c0_seq1.p1 gnl/MRDRNA2_/MRDRNA2_121280_c0~~gnl/MRDRNA2_/MRDRNA2_121280_c0_seq1.p1  ORF type:complete len:585 (+),score=151.25 gnl/MRDRNA2_/MRDRNA2_121280_c0_seq1:125-1756(+)